jgi:hypothetical protein
MFRISGTKIEKKFLSLDGKIQDILANKFVICSKFYPVFIKLMYFN